MYSNYILLLLLPYEIANIQSPSSFLIPNML